jgi:nucleotide-binding universal stress UspA family protein
MRMTLTMLVPLDGSPVAERALAVPPALAAHTAVRVVLAQVGDRTSGHGETAAYLENQAAALRKRGVPTATSVLRGHVATALVEEAGRQAVDLLVMVRRDRERFDGWWHRSVTADVLAAAPVPLLLLHAAHEPPLPVLSADLRLIVPLDGSSRSRAALPIARRLAELLGAPVRLVRAVSNEDILSAPIFAADGRPITALDTEAALVSARVHDDLTRVGESLGLGPERVECDVRFGPPADVLRAVEAECAPALLVMATHGYTGLRRAALGSVVADILHHGDRPVLLVRPREQTGPLTPQRIAEEARAESRS